MRIAALYDIHGNLPALEAVLADARRAGVDLVVVGGDVVPGPMAREALEHILALDVPVRCLRGNGEREVLARRAGIETGNVPAPFREVVRWSAEQLEAGHESVLASWPPTLRFEVPQIGSVLFCHATPRSDSEIFLRTTAEERLRPIFDETAASLVVCGHTHMQFDRAIGATRVVNAGSVGMPFGEPGAYWLLLGPDIELRRTDYDLEKAAARIRATAYPQAEELAASVVRPRSEAEMLALFAKNELK